MPSKSRIGDIYVEICCCRPPIPCMSTAGIIVTGADSSETEGSSDARIGDIGANFCGYAMIVVSGSSLMECEGSANARIGDVTAGCTAGIIVTGAKSNDVGG